MEYILNKLDKKTTNGFKINDIKLDLTLKENEFDNYKISGDYKKIKIDKVIKSTQSKMGLSFDNSLSINIKVEKYVIVNKPIIFEFDFDKKSNLVVEFNIEYDSASKADFIILFKSINENIHFNFYKENLINSASSNGSITLINMLNENSKNFFSIENEVMENANISHNIIDIGANIKISNVISKLTGYKSYNKLNSIYIGVKNDIIDINYNLINKHEKSTNDMIVEGTLDDTAKKNFRGTIDLQKNAKLSEGNELENCVLLSDTCKSKSLPMLLCHEDNVKGSHGVSCGKIDEDKIFYLTSRGLSKKEAEKLIIKANFNKIIKNIPDEKIREEIILFIDKKIK